MSQASLFFREDQGLILYYGLAITERIKQVRNLASLNAACTNRILRLASALKQENRLCCVLSSGIYPNIRSSWSVVPAVVERVSGLVVITLSQIWIRCIGFLLSPISGVLAVRSINVRHKIKTFVYYNFSIDSIFVALWCKIMYKCKMVMDLEDVVVPKFSDWRRGSPVNPVRVLFFWLSMRIAICLADVIIVPASKFKAAIPSRKDVVVINGCQDIVSLTGLNTEGDAVGIKMLLNGNLSQEHGARILSDALNLIQREHLQLKAKLELFITGNDPGGWFKKTTEGVRWLQVHHLGFLSTEEFENVYSTIDVCFALMDPSGRYGAYKTPSKGYEAICRGKALIVADVGDFKSLPNDVCYHLREYSAGSLAGLLCNLTCEDVVRVRRNALEYAKTHYDTAIVRTEFRRFGL